MMFIGRAAAAASVVNSLSTVPWMLAQVGLYRVLVRFYRPLPASMPVTTAEDIQAIRDRWDRATLTITDLAGDGDHYKARIVSPAFAGLPRVRQHQLVYAALKGQMGGELHALALETSAPAQAG
jgi:stress-induced morphogen